MDTTVITHEPGQQVRDAPPLLFVHGAYAGGWCWAEHFLPYFANLGYRAHAIDLQRHMRGHWPQRLSPYASITDYVDAVEETVDRLGEPPVLIGHSMGGYVVQRYLARAQVPAVVLLASVPPQGLLPATAWLAFGNPLLFQQIQLLQWFGPQTVFALYGTEGGRRPLFSPHLPDAKVREYASRAELESPTAIMDMWLPLTPRPKSSAAVNALVLGARLDALMPASSIHWTADAFGTRARFIDDVGHAMMLDQHWQRVAIAIDGWLTGQGM